MTGAWDIMSYSRAILGKEVQDRAGGGGHLEDRKAACWAHCQVVRGDRQLVGAWEAPEAGVLTSPPGVFPLCPVRFFSPVGQEVAACPRSVFQ